MRRTRANKIAKRVAELSAVVSVASIVVGLFNPASDVALLTAGCIGFLLSLGAYDNA